MPTNPGPEHDQVIALHGQDVTVKQFSFGSENAYDDKPRQEDSSTTVSAIVDRSGGDVLRDAAGVARTRTIRLTVTDAVTVSETEPATRFVVDGVTYEVEFVDDQVRAGVQEVTARRLDFD